jgi:hypothetical protein
VQILHAVSYYNSDWTLSTFGISLQKYSYENIQRYLIIYVDKSSCNERVTLSYFNKNRIFYTDLKKFTYIKLHENPSDEKDAIVCGRTDRDMDE